MSSEPIVYPEYKDTRHAWLGKVPAHWKVVPGFAAFYEKQVKNTGMKVTDVLSLSYGKIVVKPPDKLHGLVPESFETYQIVDPGDIIIRPTDLQNDWNSIRVGLSQHRGIITSAYMCLKPTAITSPEYCYLLLLAFDLLKFFYGLGSGLRQNLDFRDLKRFPFLVPPPEEQAAIVRYISVLDQKVNRLVRSKRRLIELLAAQKIATIYSAVTHGLNSRISLKDSGLRWAPRIPEHWDLVPNKAMLRIRKKLVGAQHGEYQLLSLTKKGVLIRDMDGGGKYSSFWGRSQEVRPGDLVFCLFDVEETPRTVGLSHHFGMISGDYTVFECSDPLAAQFIELFYRAMDDRKLLRPLYTGLRNRIHKPEFLSTVTPMPPRSEQQAIVDSIKLACVKSDSASSRLEAEIKLLREYQGRLIADIVTGKLDVRAVAAELPDAKCEPEALAEDPEEDESEAYRDNSASEEEVEA